MTDATAEKAARAQALARLRETRRGTIEAAAARMREQRKAVKALKAALGKGALTVPEMAEATGLSTSDAMWYVATLKKYGEIQEGEKDGDYFRYRGVPQEGAKAAGGEGE